MKCKEVLSLLSPYQDNELDKERCGLVKAHLRSCESCRLEFEKLKDLNRMVSSMTEIETPASFNAVIMGRIREDRVGRVGFVKAISYSFISAAFFLLGIFFYTVPGDRTTTGERVVNTAGEILKIEDFSVLDLNIERLFKRREVTDEKRFN